MTLLRNKSGDVVAAPNVPHTSYLPSQAPVSSASPRHFASAPTTTDSNTYATGTVTAVAYFTLLCIPSGPTGPPPHHLPAPPPTHHSVYGCGPTYAPGMQHISSHKHTQAEPVTLAFGCVVVHVDNGHHCHNVPASPSSAPANAAVVKEKRRRRRSNNMKKIETSDNRYFKSFRHRCRHRCCPFCKRHAAGDESLIHIKGNSAITHAGRRAQRHTEYTDVYVR